MGLFNKCVEERLDSYIDALRDLTKEEYREYHKLLIWYFFTGKS